MKFINFCSDSTSMFSIGRWLPVVLANRLRFCLWPVDNINCVHSSLRCLVSSTMHQITIKKDSLLKRWEIHSSHRRLGTLNFLRMFFSAASSSNQCHWILLQRRQENTVEKRMRNDSMFSYCRQFNKLSASISSIGKRCKQEIAIDREY